MVPTATTVGGYLQSLPNDRRVAMARVCSMIRRSARGVRESMRFGLAFYEQDGPVFAVESHEKSLVLYFAEPGAAEGHEGTWKGLDVEHRRIVFNGNNYSKEWVEEAERRGLMNLASAPDAYDAMLAPKNIEVFSEFGIYSSIELHSRSEILNEEYSKTIHIEALTMIDMINRQVMPAVIGYSARIASSIAAKRAALPEMNLDAETDRLAEIGALENDLHHAVKELEKAVAIASGYSGSPLAHYYRNTVLPLMDEVRTHCDALELIVGQKDWPYPTYGEMLFYV